MTVPAKKRTDAQVREIAKAYIDKQFGVMKKHGLATVKITRAEYKALIDDTAVRLKA